ncbi:MAG: tyrosine--tRNA ligase [Bacilli bacterium]|jgi:tyrosyl-tRNA synthetase|nr:tyrosine--tRNA ligase [Bacilli bacterium]
MDIFDDLKYRNLIKDFSNENEVRELLKTPQTIYCGFDPSASSMHIGNFVMISLLMRLQKSGHRIIAVVGGATGMIGDPSGKSKERNLQDKDTLQANTLAIKNQLERFLDLSDPEKGLIVNNYDWLSKYSYLDFLRDFGRYFTINYMLAKDVVASRMETGISYTEFSYMILQSVDFLTLHQQYHCNMQIGGSDQWGNLTAGLDLIRRVEGQEAKVGCMTAHLITKSDGKKFGKSEDGALFLDRKLTSPYKLYQYFINTSDEDAIRYLRVFTFLSKDEIEKIAIEHDRNPSLRLAQKTLAYEVVKTIHSKNDAERVIKMSEALFSGEVTSLSEEEITELFASSIVKLKGVFTLEDLLIEVKAAKSKREAREFIQGNSILINGKKHTDPSEIVTPTDALFGRYTLLRRGKKNYYLIEHIN